MACYNILGPARILGLTDPYGFCKGGDGEVSGKAFR